MKITKKAYSLLCFLMIVSLLSGIKNIQAGSYSISANKSSVNVGESITVTIQVNGGVVRPTISASGSCKYSSGGFAEQIDSMGATSQSVTYSATSEGTCNISVSGTYTDYDTEEQKSISKNFTISVKKKDTGGFSNNGSNNNNGGSNNSGSNTGNNNQPTKPKANFDLNVFKMNQGTLSPKYSNSVNKYSVTLPAKTTSLQLSITPADSAIQVSGNGTHQLKAGNNKIEVTLYDAYTKESRKITLDVYVEEEPEVYLDFSDESLGINPNFKDVKIPDGFEKIKLTIDKKEVNALQNKKGLTLLYMVNQSKEKELYIYNVNENKIVSKYQPLKIDGNIYFVSAFPNEYIQMEGFEVGKMQMDGVEIQTLKYKASAFSNYSLLYLMNDSGETFLYQYEATQGTLQLYNHAAAITQKQYEDVIKEKEKTMTYVYIAGGIAGLMTILSMIGFVMTQKYKKRVINTRRQYNDMISSVKED